LFVAIVKCDAPGRTAVTTLGMSCAAVGPLFTAMVAAMGEFDEAKLAAAAALHARMSDVIGTNRGTAMRPG